MNTNAGNPESLPLDGQSVSTQQASDLLALVQSCADVDEFRNVLHNRGIWLNQRAAESAFFSLRVDEDAELDDASLAAVVGGVNSHGVDSQLLNMILAGLSS